MNMGWPGDTGVTASNQASSQFITAESVSTFLKYVSVELIDPKLLIGRKNVAVQLLSAWSLLTCVVLKIPTTLRLTTFSSLNQQYRLSSTLKRINELLVLSGL